MDIQSVNTENEETRGDLTYKPNFHFYRYVIRNNVYIPYTINTGILTSCCGRWTADSADRMLVTLLVLVIFKCRSAALLAVSNDLADSEP